MRSSIKRPHLGALLCFFLTGAAVAGSDWPQYRGPNHDGTSPEKILKSWPASGPAQVWKVPMTDGFSAISVAGGEAFTLVSREVDGASQEVCVALDAATGKEKWSAPLGVGKFDRGGDSGAPGNDGGDGPRSTPAYSDGRVYTYSSRMVLKCLDASTGKEIWKSDIIAEHEGSNIHWGSAASPLVEGDMVIVPGGGPGQALLAFNKKDGQVVWKAGNDKMTQSTPVAATILGTRQIIFITGAGMFSVKAADGEMLWQLPFKIDRAVGMSPVVSGDLVYCSVAYNLGSRVCKISREGDKFTATELWFIPGNSVVNHWSTPVCTGGYLYGLFGQAKYAEAPLQCVELATGKVLWSKKGFGPGGCTLIDGQILVLSDAGDLVMVKATPEQYTEVARSHVLDGKCWNGVGVSNGRVYARSTKEGVCLDVSVKTAMK